MQVPAKFPATLWNGLDANHVHGYDDVDPNHFDYDRVAAEIVALETVLNALQDPSFNTTIAPLIAKGTDPGAITFGTLWTFQTKDIILALGSAAASFALGYTIPAGSLVFGAALNVESTITLSTAIWVGVGIGGALTKYGHTVGGTKNTKSTLAMTPTAIAGSGEVLSVYATDGSSLAAGTIANGSIRVRLLIGTQSALPDAA